jgi:dTDP-4-amino-4,6-dideoxygalactose transaminase
MNSKIWLSPPHMGGDELNFVNEAFESNWIAPLGPHVDNFEKELSQYTGVKHTAALSSGTAALHLALIMLDVKAGDEVICQSFTFSASANPIAYQGAIPVFIDSESDTWNMDPDLLEKAIVDRINLEKKPKAIIIVHLYGMPAKNNFLKTISEKYKSPAIIDAAEALGSRYCGEHVGGEGAIGILSFNGNKIITTSGGGAMISNNEEYVKRARFLATQARDNAPHYQHSEIGYNYRMSNVIAGIGRGQIRVIDKRVEQRRKNYDFYFRELSQFEGISFLKEPDGHFSNRWLTTIIVDPVKTLGITREDIRLALERENIEARPLWKPMHLQPVFKDAPSYLNGISEELFNKGLCLPSGSSLTEEDLNRISVIIKKELNK